MMRPVASVKIIMEIDSFMNFPARSKTGCALRASRVCAARYLNASGSVTSGAALLLAGTWNSLHRFQESAMSVLRPSATTPRSTNLSQALRTPRWSISCPMWPRPCYPVEKYHGADAPSVKASRGVCLIASVSAFARAASVNHKPAVEVVRLRSKTNSMLASLVNLVKRICHAPPEQFERTE